MDEELEYIGRELVYTEYVRVPAHVDRHEHYVEKYACHACEDGTGEQAEVHQPDHDQQEPGSRL